MVRWTLQLYCVLCVQTSEQRLLCLARRKHNPTAPGVCLVCAGSGCLCVHACSSALYNMSCQPCMEVVPLISCCIMSSTVVSGILVPIIHTRHTAMTHLITVLEYGRVSLELQWHSYNMYICDNPPLQYCSHIVDCTAQCALITENLEMTMTHLVHSCVSPPLLLHICGFI